jgi:hypothetical protein
MRSLYPTLVLAVWMFAGCLFSGCLYTTHHFNSGRLLEPGQTAVTFGYGKAQIYDLACADREAYVYSDSTGEHCQRYYGGNEFTGPADSMAKARPILEETSIPKGSFAYRLGVRGAWGPFTGVEMGWKLEAPTNPISAEFDFKFGLPVPHALPFRHSLSAGWIVGNWSDNSWFSEYAVNGPFGESCLYGNYRVTYLATQYQDLEYAFEKWHFISNQKFIHQVATGFYWKLPDVVLLPDFLSPQVIATFPVVPAFAKIPHAYLSDYAWGINLGIGWDFK